MSGARTDAPQGHPDRVQSWKGHGPDHGRWMCCRMVIDGPHADECPNHHCHHEDEAARILALYLRLQEAVVAETKSLPMVRDRILAVCDGGDA